MITETQERELAGIFADSFAARGDDSAMRGDWSDASVAYAKAAQCNVNAGHAKRAGWQETMARKCAIIAEVDSLTPQLIREFEAPARRGARPIRVDIRV